MFNPLFVSEYSLITLNIFFLLILSITFYKYKAEGLKEYYWPALILKITCGILYGCIYLYYYRGGDTFAYFQQGVKIAALGKENISDYLKLIFFNHNDHLYHLHFTPENNPRSFWITKAISPFLIITNSNYWISGCYLSLFSFFGIYYLAEALVKVYKEFKKEIVISFFLFPSFLFWSSGLTKESLAIGSLFYMIAICFQVIYSNKVGIFKILLFVLFFWFLWQVRFFYLAVFLMTFGIYLVYHFLTEKIKIPGSKKLLIIALLAIIFLSLISQMDYSLNYSNLRDNIVYGYFINYNKNPSNAIKYFNLQPNFLSLLINSPLALISGLFRPFVFDVQTLPMVFVGIENLALFILLIGRIKSFGRSYNYFEKTIWLYVVTLALFLALSTPNFGTLTRYKVGFLPLFLFLLMKGNWWIKKCKNKVIT